MTGQEAFEQFCYHRPPSVRELKALTEQQNSVYNLARRGWTPKNISGRMNIPIASVYDALAKIRHWGYEI